tara:strand:+ start:269368 stop:269958 length:591 start_codon:yes stop_codon:yes gene_type:complete
MSLGEMTEGKLRILRAVSTLLEDPAGRVTISKIAKTIHVTDAAIYRHYKSKDEIFSSLLAYMETNLLGPFNAAQQESQDTVLRMSTVFNHYMDFIEGHPGLARLYLGHGATEASGVAERIKMLHAKMRSQIAQILRIGQARNELAEGLSPEQGTEIFYGMLVSASMAQVYGFPMVEVSERWEAFSVSTLGVASRAV